jgi:ubiquitin carboxyl-terminal hydrolase 31
MNAILQCLSYTDLLAEYFVLDQYKADLKRRRRLLPFSAGGKTAAAATAAGAGNNGGGRGELTEQLALVLKSLWSLQYDPEISDKFKSLGMATLTEEKNIRVLTYTGSGFLYCKVRSYNKI